MDFTSDNAVGAAPEILAALLAANDGPAAGYGADDWSQGAIAALRDVFECPALEAFFVITGSAANALGLAALTAPHGAVLCHEASHVQTDECGAPEFFTHGAKLLPLSGGGGKLTPDAVEDALRHLPAGVVHRVQAQSLSLTQATECGTVYTPTEIRDLSAVAHGHGLRVHMDGARFANAVAALDRAPADLTWRAGVDVLSFGATKNGALAAEAVIFFDPALAGGTSFARKRGGHLLSKGRLLGAQWQAYLADDLWLRLACHANEQARVLADGLRALPGIDVVYPVQANEIFVTLPKDVEQTVREAGARFYPWDAPGDPPRDPDTESLFRLVTSFATAKEDVALFIEVVRSAIGRPAGKDPL